MELLDQVRAQRRPPGEGSDVQRPGTTVLHGRHRLPEAALPSVQHASYPCRWAIRINKIGNPQFPKLKKSARDRAPATARARTLEALEVAVGRRLEEPPLRRAGT